MEIYLKLIAMILTLTLPSCGIGTSKIEVQASGGVRLAEVEKIRPLAAKPQDTVKITGQNFLASKNLKARVAMADGTPKDVPLSVTDRNNASFAMPEGAGLGMRSVKVIQGTSTEVGSFNLIANQADNELPIWIGDASEICSTSSYLDINGETKTGTKDCAGGSSLPNCSSDGAGSCVVDGTTYKAAKLSNFDASKVLTGTIVAGVPGTAPLRPADCNSNGQQSCVATGSYFAGTACDVDGSNCFLPTYSVPGLQTKKAVDVSTIDSSKMLDTLTVSGVTGSILSRGSWDLTTSFPGAGYYSGTTNIPTDTTIATGTTILGVPGTAVLKPADCNSNGATGCVTTASYKSADLTNLSADNIKSGVTIAGQLGDYPSATNPLDWRDQRHG